MAERKEGDDESVLEGALDQLEAQNVAPLNIPSFNTADLLQFFTDHTVDNLLDEFGTREQFNEQIKRVFKRGFAQQDPKLIQSIIVTLGQAAQNIDVHHNLDPLPIIEDAISKAGVDLENVGMFEGKIFQPVDVGQLIETLFDTDLDRLQKRDLSLDEINAIRQEFDNNLDNLEADIAAATEVELEMRAEGEAEDEIFLFGQNTLRMLQDYLDTHIENNQLRQLLLTDVQTLIANNRQKLGIQIGTAPATIIPISATQTLTIRNSLKNALVNVVKPEVEKIRARFLAAVQADVAAGQIFRVPDALNDSILSLVRTYNSFITKQQIKDPETGALITIPTEIREEVNPGVFRNRPATFDMLLFALNNGINTLSNPTQNLEYVPMTIRDAGTGQTKEMIVRDLVTMERELKAKASRGIPRKNKTLVSSISKRAGLRNIKTMMAMRRVQETTMINGVKIKSHGANMREIRINKDVTLAELAKLANMLLMENGSLETISEMPLLDIVKGVTTIQEVVNALMSVQKMKAGNDYSVLFVPANVFGGMFLDGPMDVIVKNRMLVNPVGGNIFSSLFNTVGNVVKTVASVPLQLAGAVFGGGLKATAVRADAPQFAGQAHVGQEFQRGGSQQPEPFGMVGDNQQFHIQPFPFGGRIDNTGFIDESQKNPKFIWGELPVNSFTFFP